MKETYSGCEQMTTVLIISKEFYLGSNLRNFKDGNCVWCLYLFLNIGVIVAKNCVMFGCSASRSYTFFQSSVSKQQDKKAQQEMGQ